jgi:hypothetical protein
LLSLHLLLLLLLAPRWLDCPLLLLLVVGARHPLQPWYMLLCALHVMPLRMLLPLQVRLLLLL